MITAYRNYQFFFSLFVPDYRSDEGLETRNASFRNPWRPIYIINTVDKNNLSSNATHRRSITVSLETYLRYS